MPCLRQVLMGVGVLRGKLGRSPRLTLPFTPSILRKMRWVWSLHGEYDRRLMGGSVPDSLRWLLHVRGGHCALQKSYDPQVHLSFRVVTVDSCQVPSVVLIFLKRTKTNQEGRGVRVILG
uniref:Uncharacterized protein n=1 Tax=Amphimedon queenslandica TaxID=400682 RepID=A0A1X7USK7_AMPQE